MDLQEAIGYVGNPEPYDEEKILEAGLTLVRNRNQLKHRIFFKIPDPGALTTNEDPKWDEIRAGSTGERCNCGNCRTIWPAFWPEFEEKEEIVLRQGDKVYVVPEGGNYLDTLVRLEVVAIPDSDQLALTILSDPFSEAIDFSMIFGGPPAYALEKLAQLKESASLKNKFPEGANVAGAEKMTILMVKSATLSEVTIIIGKGTAVSRDPKTEFPRGHGAE